MTTPVRWLGSLVMAFSLILMGCSGGDDNSKKDEAASNDSGSMSESSEPAKPVTWRFALEEIEGSVQDAYAKEFKREMEDASGGKIKIEIYPYGSLGTSSQLTELVQNGSVELAFASPGHLASVIPEVGVFTLNFVLSDNNDVNEAVLSSDKVHNLFEPPYNKQGLELLSIVPEGWMVWTANKPLRTPADFDNFKMRTMTSPILTETYKAYGANPSPMPYSEVYSGLQLKQIDGQVNPVFAIEEMSFYEVQDYLIEAHNAQFISTVISNKDWYDNLPEQQRKWLDQTRDKLVSYIYKKQEEYNNERLQKIKDNSDTKVITLTSEERDKFRQASMPVRQTYIDQAGDNGKKILDTITSMVAEKEKDMK